MSGQSILFVFFAIIVILISLIIHETGHFVFAKIFKINVKEFSIGIGPKIFSKDFKRTKFSLRAFPVMAYVMVDSKKITDLYKEILAEHVSDVEKFKLENGTQLMTDPKLKRKYDKMLVELEKYQELAKEDKNKTMIDDVAIWKQLLVFFGGVLFNLIFMGIFYLILEFGLASIIEAIEQNLPNGQTLQTNPFAQLGGVFINLGKNMVFYNAWKPEGATGSSGSFIGDAIAINNMAIDSNLLTYIIVNYLVVYNLVLFIFNLIPIPPLDGFKIVNTALRIKTTKKAENILTFIGVGLIGYMFLTGIVADIITGING